MDNNLWFLKRTFKMSDCSRWPRVIYDATFAVAVGLGLAFSSNIYIYGCVY